MIYRLPSLENRAGEFSMLYNFLFGTLSFAEVIYPFFIQ